MTIRQNYIALVAGLALHATAIGQAPVGFTLLSGLSRQSTADATIVTGDFNGDGWTDWACKTFAGKLLVYFNTGSGAFAAPFILNPGVMAAIAAADLNGDGLSDFATVGLNDGTLSVFTNNLVTGYSPAGTYAVGVSPSTVTAGDFNGDGRPDLVVANKGSGADTGSLMLFANDGRAGFTPGSTLTSDVGGPVWVRVADVNADGRADLVWANGAAGDFSLVVHTNDGSGGFVRATLLPNLAMELNADALVGDLADVDGDGRVDIVVPNRLPALPGIPISHTISVLTNAGNGVFALAAAPHVTQVSTVRNNLQVLARDMNGDGRPDLVVQSDVSSDMRVSVLTNAGGGQFSFAAAIFAGSKRTGLGVADLNGDGKPDILSGSWDTADVQYYVNTTPSPSPALRILPVDGETSLLFWEKAAAPFTLQMKAGLDGNQWVSVTNGLPVTGVSLKTALPVSFFRLVGE